MAKSNLTPEILAAALSGLEAQRERLDAQIAAVKRMLRVGAQQPEAPATPAAAPAPKRKMSAAGRRRIVEATKKRWAEYNRKKAEAAKTADKAAAKGKKKTAVQAAKASGSAGE